MSTVLERINEMAANHYREGEAFQRDQARRLGDVLWDLIHILEVERIDSVNAPFAEGDGLLFSMWRVSDVLAAARARMSTPE